MKKKLSRRARALTSVTLLALVAAGVAVAVQTPAGPRTLTRFEPDRLAELETEMWQAYYAKQRVRLFMLLVATLREQYGYSWARALQAGYHFARAAADFGDSNGNYELVLPDLEAGYVIARDWTSASFDPAAIARAELAWWTVRRTRDQSDVATVGRLIAEEYALLYCVPFERVSRAGALRAEAGQLRDQGGAQADWDRVHALLIESYRGLKSAVSAVPADSPLSR
jgi:hypothetical protein